MPGVDPDAYRDRPVCVTGGAGFIGSHLVIALARLGARIAVIDDLSTGRAENLDPVRVQVRFIEGSILDAEALREAVAGAEIVFHLAAFTSVPRSVAEPGLCFQVNAEGTLRVLEAVRGDAARHGAAPARVIYAGSSSVYGDQPGSPKIESMRPDPLSPYAAAKLAGEHLLRACSISYGLPSITLRYFNIFGPGQRAHSPYAAVIPRFAEAMRSGRRPVIFGDGLQSRDFTPVANAVHGNLLAGAHPGSLHGEAVNLALGESRTLTSLARRMAEILGVEPAWDHAPPRAGEVRHSRADVSAARALIGYEPVQGFEEGLGEYLRCPRAGL